MSKLGARGLILLLIILCIGPRICEATASPSCESVVKRFLASPGRHTLITLTKTEQLECWSFISSSNSKFNILIGSVGKGNRWSAEYLARNLSSLDGGNLEDSLIALGEFADKDMKNFLIFSRDGLISTHELLASITALPLSLSDQMIAQLNALSIRKSKLIKVKRSDLLEIRALAIKAVDEFSSEVSKHLSEESTVK